MACERLINRGPDSYKVLQRLYAMADQCRIVLGNHDLHFLAMLFGGHSPGRSDTLDELLQADDVYELGHWLRQQLNSSIYRLKNNHLVHGIPPSWSNEQAMAYAAEVEAVMQGKGDIPTQNFPADVRQRTRSLARCLAGHVATARYCQLSNAHAFAR